jgi:hypothetical protein
MENIDYCIGWYYNFKKGTEHCKNRKFCKHYQYYLSLVNNDKPYYNMPKVDFKGIKIFRKCERYKDTPQICDMNKKQTQIDETNK